MPVVDTKALTVTSGPTADAGPDDETCSDQATYTVIGSTVSVGTIAWTSSSGGTFADATIDNPVYNINATDITNTTVTLTKTASSAGCSDVMSSMILTVTPAPTADAGLAAEVCSDTPFTVADAAVTNDLIIIWTHDGGGALTSATTVTPTYTPIVADGGSVVTLTLTVTGNGSCANVVDTKALTITSAPTADAGLVDEVCSDTPYTVVDAVVTNDITITWTHDGGGALTNANTLAPTYTPIVADGGNVVTLTLSVGGNGSCLNALDTKALTVTAAPTADAGLADTSCSNTGYTVIDAIAANGSILRLMMD